MRALIQRVTRAQVRVDSERVAAIGLGMLVLLGVGPQDDEQIAMRLADKVRKLRIFRDAAGKMNLNVEQAGGACLVVSQFTLYGDTRGGNRPGFSGAAAPEKADALYRWFVDHLRSADLEVQTGRFGNEMEVELVNDGPVTLWLDSAELLG